MAPAAVPDTLPCDSGAVFTREAKDAKDILSLEETEESWEHIRRSICRLHALYKGGGWQFEQDVVLGLKTLLRPIINAMNSERSKLSFEAVDFVASLASLGRAFDPLLNHLFDALLKLCLKTSRILVARVQAAIMRVVEETTLPGILSHLREAVKDKNQNLRATASDAVLLAMNTFAPRDLTVRVTDVEEIMRSTGRDANPGVRQTSRKIFEAYQILFPERVDSFTAPLTPIMKKYLGVRPRAAALNKSTKAVPFVLPTHDTHVPNSAPSGKTEFPSSSSHTRSASASESHHVPQAQRELAPQRPALRTQRSRPAMRAEVPLPSAPAQAAEQAAQSFQPTRSAPAPGPQRQRTASTLSAKSAMSALGVVGASGHQPVERRGPQRVLSTDVPPVAASTSEHPRIVSGPSRVQRPATAMGTISTSSSSGSMGPPAPVVTHRAQRVLVPAPPPPPPSAPEKPVERAPSRQDKERPTHSRTGSGSRSNPPTRPASAASMASRAKPVAVTSRPPTAASTRSVITASKPPLSRSATTSRPPLSKSATAAPHAKPVAAPARKDAEAAKHSKTAPPAERTGFVPKRNREATGAGGATQMTASALARAKELREARERVAAAKVKASKKPGPAPLKKPAKPVEVPLPPSPGCPPREVPLPSSPEPLDLSPAESENKPESRETRPGSRGKENVPEQHKLEVAALVAKLVPLALEQQAADSFGVLDADEDELAGVEFAHGHAFGPQGEVVHTVARERMVLGAVNAQ